MKPNRSNHDFRSNLVNAEKRDPDNQVKSYCNHSRSARKILPKFFVDVRAQSAKCACLLDRVDHTRNQHSYDQDVPNVLINGNIAL